MPPTRPHDRTGAALYYVLAGTGANTVAGTTEAKGPGSFAYEPSELGHQWGNAGDEPFTFLVFNTNPEGMAAVVPAVPVNSPYARTPRIAAGKPRGPPARPGHRGCGGGPGGTSPGAVGRVVDSRNRGSAR